LALLWVAEDEAPWGEAAATQRMQHLGEMMVAASDGYKVETRQSAGSRAHMILRRLLGLPEKKRRRKSNVSAVTGR
jgi:hypothetical protein